MTPGDDSVHDCVAPRCMPMPILAPARPRVCNRGPTRPRSPRDGHREAGVTRACVCVCVCAQRNARTPERRGAAERATDAHRRHAGQRARRATQHDATRRDHPRRTAFRRPPLFRARAPRGARATHAPRDDAPPPALLLGGAARSSDACAMALAPGAAFVVDATAAAPLPVFRCRRARLVAVAGARHFGGATGANTAAARVQHAVAHRVDVYAAGTLFAEHSAYRSRAAACRAALGSRDVGRARVVPASGYSRVARDRSDCEEAR